MKLIDKDAVVAEIEKRIKHYNLAVKEFGDEGYKDNVLIEQCKASACKRILSFLDTLEVKDVDLEKELDVWRHEHFHGRRDNSYNGEYLKRSSQLNIAKHFFELGLKAQKGE